MFDNVVLNISAFWLMSIMVVVLILAVRWEIQDVVCAAVGWSLSMEVIYSVQTASNLSLNIIPSWTTLTS